MFVAIKNCYGVLPVKKILFSLLAATITIASSLAADVDPQDLGPTEINGVRESDDRGPFKVVFTLDAVGKAKIKDFEFGRHLEFGNTEVELSAVFYHNASYNEGASVGIAYDYSRFKWGHNPFFKQQDFQTATINLNFSSERLCDWIWKGQFSINFDNLEYWNWSDYMNYNMLLWGRYNYCNVGINLGFLALTGMKIDRVYPVIGVDWKWGEKWDINLVFPTNISVAYSINKSWAVLVAGRVFFERHRLRRNEILNKGLFVYSTAGAEVGINYTPNSKVLANIHAGYDLGGRFKRANMHYHNKRNYTLEGAPYAGCELDYAF